MTRWLRNAVLCAAGVIFATLPALATETISYTYDALGRLTAVQSSGDVNNGQNVATTYDAAGNRTNQTVTGASAGGGGSPLQLSVAGASVTEGGTLSFAVTRSGDTSGAASATYSTADGTAVQPGDYTAQTNVPLSFAAGQASATISVVTIDDSAVESAETMTVTVHDASSGATLASATGTINDNDTASPAQLAIGNASVTEGGTLSFTVTRSGTTTTAVSAHYATASGTATSGSDFTAKSGTVSFAAGQTSQSITVATTDDGTVESAETMTVTLSSPSSGATITTATGTGTINDNDVAPPAQLAIGNASVTEGGTLSFTVTRSGTTTTAVSAHYATASGTAASGSDFTANSGTLSFSAGQTSQSITVATTDDGTAESAETMTVTLSSPSSGATITTATGTGTINDNDGTPATLAIAFGPTVTEGGILVFTVTRSGGTANAVSVDYASASGSATSGTDFTAVSGTLTIPAGQTSGTISVHTTDDHAVEALEDLRMNLSNPNGATITTATSSGFIRDNDGGGGF